LKTNLQKYPAYKPSGVEWLGEIPEHWELTRLGTRFEERKTKVSDKDYAPLSVTKNGTVPQLDSAAKSNDGDNRKLVKNGDFVINSRSDRKGSSGISDRDGSVSLIYIVLEPNDFHPIYCNYFLRCHAFIEEFYRMGHGIVADLWTTRYDEMKSIMVVIPSKEEQTAIATFLDRKTALIDQAIGIKEKQIDLLKERRQILIHKAVTRGLNPDVKLKDSGVEWIGEIPDHWEVKKVKYILKERNERSVFGEEPLLMMSQIHGLVVRADYHDKAEVAQSNEGNKIVYKNDLVFNKLKAHLGVFFKSNIEFKGIVSPDYAVYYSTGAINDLKFLELLFRNPEYIREFICRATGIVEGLIRLYTPDLFDIPVSVPPIFEQVEILEYVDISNQKIGTAISLKEKEIEKLKEYKVSLINSAVTGKIKVN
jgi:type I restriction enzyme S subunit